MSNNHYLAITIGPIFRTIKRARKTRELWAASYIFSLLMRRILQQLKNYQVIVPSIENVSLDDSPHGAGLWHDRCIVQLEGGTVPDVKSIIDATLDQIAADLKLQNKNALVDLFDVKVLCADWRKEEDWNTGANGSEDDLAPIHRINRLLDNLELQQHYQPVEPKSLNQVLEAHIHDLYEVAGHKGSKVFIHLEDGSVRLPSLPEIALSELKSNPAYNAVYQIAVEEKLNKKIMEARRGKGRAKDLEGYKEEEQFYRDLKQSLPSDSILFRHKYVAVVVSDGDNLGKIITGISQGKLNISLSDFSKRLRTFSVSAVQKIADFQGLPVYAGGDDLLFLAPVVNEKTSVFDLCMELNQAFQKEMGLEGVSMSFGVSIQYYKHPLGEAVEAAYALEQKAKNFQLLFEEDKEADGKLAPRHKKNAICFQVQKHSGQQFGATLWMGNPAFTDAILQLLKSDAELDEAFLTSLMHKLQSIPGLLADAAKNNRLEPFRLHHFNEGGKHEKEYLVNALDLAGMIFKLYGDSLAPEMEKEIRKDKRYRNRPVNLLDIYHTELLFALLRLKQFLIQKDHD